MFNRHGTAPTTEVMFLWMFEGPIYMEVHSRDLFEMQYIQIQNFNLDQQLHTSQPFRFILQKYIRWTQRHSIHPTLKMLIEAASKFILH